MLFRGTERHPTSYDINFAFESLGGTLYAETGRDYSLFQVTLVPEQLEGGLELFGEVFAGRCSSTSSSSESSSSRS